jgi:hypothetical protein
VTFLLSPPLGGRIKLQWLRQIRWMKPLTRDMAERWGGVRGEWTPEALERASSMATYQTLAPFRQTEQERASRPLDARDSHVVLRR